MSQERIDFLEDLRWIEVKNNSNSLTIPSFGLMRIVSVDTTTNIITVDQPNADSQDVLVNSVTPIPPSGYGSATRETPTYVAYNAGDGTPATGDTWGAASGSYLLRNNNSQQGFTINGGVIDGRVSVNRMSGGGLANNMGWLKRTTIFGSSFDFVFSGGILIATGAATISPVPANLNYMAGDTIIISDGAGNSITATVTGYSGTTLNYTGTATTGSGTISGMNVACTGIITTTRISTTLWAATLYDYDFNAINSVWVSDPNYFEPTIGIFYMCQKGKGPIRLRDLWWINRSGPVVLSVSCDSNNQPNSTFGAAL